MNDMTLNLEAVSGDSRRVEQVIYHIIFNAIKYSPNNSKINVVIKNFDCLFTCRVIDNGPGIDCEEVPKIFNPFYNTAVGQIIEQRMEEDIHFGFGLNLSQKIIK
jgi:signal transduction histidine kinase